MGQRATGKCDASVVIALVGNKLDLESLRQVEKIDGARLAEEMGLLNIECSAKSGENVVSIFNEVANILPEPLQGSGDDGFNSQARESINLSEPRQGGSCAC